MSDEDINDAVEKIADAISMAGEKIAESITPFTPLGGHAAEDASGGFVASLTEAVMGVTAGLFKIAGAIDALAEAVREKMGESK